MAFEGVLEDIRSMLERMDSNDAGVTIGALNAVGSGDPLDRSRALQSINDRVDLHFSEPNISTNSILYFLTAASLNLMMLNDHANGDFLLNEGQIQEATSNNARMTEKVAQLAGDAPDVVMSLLGADAGNLAVNLRQSMSEMPEETQGNGIILAAISDVAEKIIVAINSQPVPIHVTNDLPPTNENNVEAMTTFDAPEPLVNETYEAPTIPSADDSAPNSQVEMARINVPGLDSYIPLDTTTASRPDQPEVTTPVSPTIAEEDLNIAEVTQGPVNQAQPLPVSEPNNQDSAFDVSETPAPPANVQNQAPQAIIPESVTDTDRGALQTGNELYIRGRITTVQNAMKAGDLNEQNVGFLIGAYAHYVSSDPNGDMTAMLASDIYSSYGEPAFLDGYNYDADAERIHALVNAAIDAVDASNVNAPDNVADETLQPEPTGPDVIPTPSPHPPASFVIEGNDMPDFGELRDGQAYFGDPSGTDRDMINNVIAQVREATNDPAAFKDLEDRNVPGMYLLEADAAESAYVQVIRNRGGGLTSEAEKQGVLNDAAVAFLTTIQNDPNALQLDRGQSRAVEVATRNINGVLQANLNFARGRLTFNEAIQESGVDATALNEALVNLYAYGENLSEAMTDQNQSIKSASADVIQSGDLDETFIGLAENLEAADAFYRVDGQNQILNKLRIVKNAIDANDPNIQTIIADAATRINEITAGLPTVSTTAGPAPLTPQEPMMPPGQPPGNVPPLEPTEPPETSPEAPVYDDAVLRQARGLGVDAPTPVEPPQGPNLVRPRARPETPDQPTDPTPVNPNPLETSPRVEARPEERTPPQEPQQPPRLSDTFRAVHDWLELADGEGWRNEDNFTAEGDTSDQQLLLDVIRDFRAHTGQENAFETLKLKLQGGTFVQDEDSVAVLNHIAGKIGTLANKDEYFAMAGEALTMLEGGLSDDATLSSVVIDTVGVDNVKTVEGGVKEAAADAYKAGAQSAGIALPGHRT